MTIQKLNHSFCNAHRDQSGVRFQFTTSFAVHFYAPGRCAAGRRPAPSRSRPSSCCSLTGCSPAACSVLPWSSLLTSSYWCRDGPLWTPRRSCRCPHVAGRMKRQDHMEEKGRGRDRRKNQVLMHLIIRISELTFYYICINVCHYNTLWKDCIPSSIKTIPTSLPPIKGRRFATVAIATMHKASQYLDVIAAYGDANLG